MFDVDTAAAFALLMLYDAEGHWLGYEYVADPTLLVDITDRLRRVEEHAVPLNVYLSSLDGA